FLTPGAGRPAGVHPRNPGGSNGLRTAKENKVEIPRIISVDDHVVEPPHVWERWLPTRYRDRGPRIVRRGIRDIDYVGTASYVEHFDEESPTKVDCWIYEDLVYTHKRMVAAAGYSKEEMTLTPITYDDLRPGCYDPKARLADMPSGSAEAP